MMEQEYRQKDAEYRRQQDVIRAMEERMASLERMIRDEIFPDREPPK